jgi:hypothetical protein
MFSILFTILIIPLVRGVVFDKQYDVYPKSNLALSYGYNTNQVCLIRKIGADFYIGIEDAYSVFRTTMVRLIIFR